MGRPHRRIVLQELEHITTDGGPVPRVLSFFGESLGVMCAAKGVNVTCVVGLGHVTQEFIEACAVRNGVANKIDYLCMDSPQKQLCSEGKQNTFDIVTLEPPAFAPTY